MGRWAGHTEESLSCKARQAKQAGRQQAGDQAGSKRASRQVRQQGTQAARSHESHPGMPDSRLYVPGGQTEHSLAA